MNGLDNDGTAKSFPHLRKISIYSCPKLAQVSVGSMPSLRVLKIEECSEAVLRSLICVSWSIVTLEIRDIKGLVQVDGEYLKHLEAVEDVKIRKCDEVRYVWESESEAYKCHVSLRKCRNLVSLGEKKEVVSNSPKSLNQVTFYECEKLESYNCPNSVEKLSITYCRSITSLTFSSPVPSSSLKFLIISNCEKLKSFPHKDLKSFTSLEYLEVGGLQKPMAEWGHQNYPSSLVEMILWGTNSGVVSFVTSKTTSTSISSSSFLLPSSLKSLTIIDFKEVETLTEVLQHLTSLQLLHIWGCPKLTDLPESTSSLRVYIQ